MHRRNGLILLLALVIGVVMSGTVGARDAEQRSVFASPILVANTSFLNIRTGPGVQFTVLVTVVGGTELPVLGVANDQVWYQVNTNLGTGWVNIEFTLPRGDFTNVPLIDFNAAAAVQPGAPDGAALGQGGGAAPAVLTGPAGSARGRVTGTIFVGGDLRAAPNFGSLVIASGLEPRRDTIYPILDATEIDGVTWYLLNLPEYGTGWVSSAEFRPLECGNDRVGLVEGPATIRFDGISTRQAFTLERLTEFYIIGIERDQFLVQLTDGTVGLVAQADVTDRPAEIVSVCTDVPPVSSGVFQGQGGGGEAPVIAAPQAVSGNRVVVNTGNLNIRRGPGAQYAIAAVAAGGTELAVTGVAGDFEWWQVQGNFGRGWVDNDFVLFRGAVAAVPIIPNAYAQPLATTSTSIGALQGQGGGGIVNQAQPAPTVSGNRVVINTGNLNVRLGPGAGFSVVAVVSGGTELAVVGVTGDVEWWLVEGSFGRGWVDNDFVLFRGAAASVPVIADAYSGGGVLAATGGAAQGQGGGGTPGQAPVGVSVTTGRSITGMTFVGGDLRAEPAFGSLVLAGGLEPRPNTIYPLLDAREIDGVTWYRLTLPEYGTGWASSAILRPLECGNDRVGTLEGPSTLRFDGISARQAFVLEEGTEFYIVGIDSDQFLVELTDGTIGKLAQADVVDRPDEVVSVCEGVVAPAPGVAPAQGGAIGQGGGAVQPAPAATGNRVVVNTGNLNVRSGPSSGFSAIATVPGGTELAVVGRTADGSWFLVEGSFGRGWVSSEFVVFRGVYTAVPIINF